MRIRNKRNSQPDQIQNPASEPNPIPVNFDDVQEGFERIGFDWKYLYLNDAAASRYGRTRESLLGCTIFEAVPVEQKSLLYNQLSVCME